MNLTGLLSFVFCLYPAFAQDTACGVFTKVIGESTEGRKQGESDWKKVRVGESICEGDAVKTGADAQLVIRMVDDNLLYLDSSTELQLSTYRTTNKKKVSILDLLYGAVRSALAQEYKEPGESFEVKTPTTVSGVRGTDFLTRYDSQRGVSEVVTFLGSVQVSKIENSGNPGPPTVVKAGFSLTIENQKPPAPPVPVPRKRLEEMKKRGDLPLDKNGRPSPDGRRDRQRPNLRQQFEHPMKREGAPTPPEAGRDRPGQNMPPDGERRRRPRTDRPNRPNRPNQK
ncbi:MAG: FecR domain-containing protein [Bdellovibrionales bacterium]